jgi:hypothetical protein
MEALKVIMPVLLLNEKAPPELLYLSVSTFRTIALVVKTLLSPEL